jgi:CRP/FNR family cyclic AMP-dependent transcriptional regulator
VIRHSVENFLESVSAGKTVVAYQPGAVVFSQDAPCDAVYYLTSGQVKMTVVSEQGKEAVLSLVNPGEFFGESCLAGLAVRMSSAVAMSDSTAIRIEKAAMVQALRDRPEFTQQFMAYLLARNERIEGDLVDQLFNSSEKRLARVLLLLANIGKDAAPEPVLANISQETLAEMIGTTRPRVSYFMNKFRKLGFISYNGDLKVHSSLLNVVLHDGPEIKKR